MKKVLITGIAGQDGSYLAEYLLGLGYEVHGLARWVSIETPESKLFRISHILDKIKMHYSSIENFSSIFQIINEVKPDECYHLAAQSYVSYSLEDESNTISSNIIGTQNLFSALRMLTPQCKLYFAASSEIFGRTEVSPQNEKTAISPRSLYGITKASGVFLSRNYREQYNMFIANGILFNHESIRRGTEFVTRKITSSAAKIKLGIIDRIELGSLESVRDWGHAKD